MSFNLRALLVEMIEKEASDLHVTAGERPKLRIDGDITDSTVTEVEGASHFLMLSEPDIVAGVIREAVMASAVNRTA